MIRYKGLRIETSEGVYEPAEDSFLLADSLDVRAGEKVLEVGSGTGLLALLAAKKASAVVGVDLNPEAVRLAQKNASTNKVDNAVFRLSDLFENVGEDLFDLIVFNPPYLPISEDDVLDRAWSGGKDGLEVIFRFLAQAPSHLKPSGRMLLLFSSLNGLERVQAACRDAGLSFELVSEKKLFFEVLYVARCYLTKQDNYLMGEL